uniref:Spike glycoprotein n=1 Tax=Xiangshan rhabdo-like virus 5 TaxID=2886228 RepID=A0A8K1YQQ7_9RHAB|nr:MAG: spike glycoprotein [Xiangshan rhabdo-like virus 5]
MKKTNMKHFIILLFLNTINSQLIKIIAPTYFLTKWQKIDSKQLECPSTLEYIHPETHNQIDITFHIPSFQQKTQYFGYICSKQTLYSSCSTSVLFQESIEITLHHEEISLTDCYNEIEKYQQGIYVHPTYPPTDCEWLHNITTNLTYIVISPYNVKYDYYINGFISPIFKNNICYESPCSTIYNNTFWITPLSFDSICNKWITAQGILSFNDKETQSVIYTDLFLPIDLNYACIDTYCNNTGLRTHKNTFITLTNGSLQNKFPSCLNKTSLHFYDTLQLAFQAELHLIDILFRERCEDIRYNLLLGKQVSIKDFDVFNPTKPGQYKVYKIKNSSIESAIAIFNYMYVSPLGTYYGISINNKSIIQNPDPDCNNNCVSSNGILVENHTYYHPKLYLKSYSELIQRVVFTGYTIQNHNPLIHPLIKPISDYHKILTTNKMTNIWNYISKSLLLLEHSRFNVYIYLKIGLWLLGSLTFCLLIFITRNITLYLYKLKD